METLKIDLTQLDSTIETYRVAYEDLDTTFTDLDEAINILKTSEWSSGASTQFFSTYDDSWKQNMTRQMQIIEFLKTNLDDAKKEYGDLYNKVHTLGQNL